MVTNVNKAFVWVSHLDTYSLRDVAWFHLLYRFFFKISNLLDFYSDNILLSFKTKSLIAYSDKWIHKIPSPCVKHSQTCI
jgi:hypothetical protein